MTLKICFIIDPITQFKTVTDTSFGLMLAAKKKGAAIYILALNDLFQMNSEVHGLVQCIDVVDTEKDFFKVVNAYHKKSLKEFDLILLRKEPPFDAHYLYATYLLEQAQRQGCFISNCPRGIRNSNEKLVTTLFPSLIPPTLVSANFNLLNDFLIEHKKIIVKPLNQMGGQGIFLLEHDTSNVKVTFELLTQLGNTLIMAQRYLPEILTQGDKRILMIQGEPYSVGLVRYPVFPDIRSNMAAGGIAKPYELDASDLKICREVSAYLIKNKLHFAGLDIIGSHLTEINITCPTGVRVIERMFNQDICGFILDSLLNSKH